MLLMDRHFPFIFFRFVENVVIFIGKTLLFGLKEMLMEKKSNVRRTEEKVKIEIEKGELKKNIQSEYIFIEYSIIKKKKTKQSENKTLNEVKFGGNKKKEKVIK